MMDTYSYMYKVVSGFAVQKLLKCIDIIIQVCLKVRLWFTPVGDLETSDWSVNQLVGGGVKGWL